MENSRTVQFRARVPSERLETAEKILQRLGLKPADAFNMLLAQIELHQGLPFEVKAPKDSEVRLLTNEEQADEWQEAFGAY